ncbi:DddA-like double-stranded DNA deaminase toxin [Saccharopolyspora hattusasensis]|uniref:DddA-like double-stranded DNA deaminase toxin n=1 Tax=Saccharopolyspora hattusasensis TaxID=1128679 RepID=UPI003D963B53
MRRNRPHRAGGPATLSGAANFKRGTACRHCEAAVRAILPRGSVLVVWTPGRDRPIEIQGETRP